MTVAEGSPHGLYGVACVTHRRYYLTCDEYEALRSRAAGRCEICGRYESEDANQKLFIDHDPAIGQYAVRGLLCNGCNSGLDLPYMACPARDQYLDKAWYAGRGKMGKRVEQERRLPSQVPAGLCGDLQEILALATRYQECLALYDDLVAAIVKALRNGEDPADVVPLSGFSAAYVRRLARHHQVPRAKAGQKRRKVVRVTPDERI